MSIGSLPPAKRIANLAAVLLLVTAATTRLQAALYHAEIESGIIPANEIGVYFNPVTGSLTNSPPPDQLNTPWLNLFFGGNGIGSSGNMTPVITAPPTGNGDGQIKRLEFMKEVGPALDYAFGFNGSENHAGDDPDQFQTGEFGYLGFAFKTSNDGPVSYGWMKVTIGELGPGMIHEWAYETTPSVSIQVGVVPEPGLSMLLFLSVAAFIVIRRR